MSSNAPIGIFDSGLGGLSVLRELRRFLPAESFIYVADNAWCPYGNKPRDVLVSRARTITGRLLEQGAKLVVVACNTSTDAAIDVLRARYRVPFVGTEPAVKPAAAISRSGVVGVLSTRATAQGERVKTLIERFAHGTKIVTQICPGLVACVECGDLDGMRTRRLVAEYTAPLIDAGADTLVLGCTHFPFLRPLIAEVAGPNVTIMDTGAAVARQVVAVLAARGLGCNAVASGHVQWLASGNVDALATGVQRLLGDTVQVKRLARNRS